MSAGLLATFILFVQVKPPIDVVWPRSLPIFQAKGVMRLSAQENAICYEFIVADKLTIIMSALYFNQLIIKKAKPFSQDITV